MEENKFKSLDDVVFEHKNKSYGAYRLRSNEKRYLLIAFLVGVSVFAVFILILFYFNLKQAKKAGTGEKKVEVVLEDVTPPDEEIQEIEEEEQPKEVIIPKDESAQLKNIMPEVQKDVPKDKEETVPNQEEFKDKNSGVKDQEGDKTNKQQGGGDKDGTGDNDKKQTTEKEQKGDPNAVYNDVKAVYPGGIDGLRKFMSSRIEYPELALDKRIQGKVVLKWVVEKDGSVSNIQVISEPKGGGVLSKEAIRVLKQTRKWGPAQKNGESVRSYYIFPIEFTLPQE